MAQKPDSPVSAQNLPSVSHHFTRIIGLPLWATCSIRFADRACSPGPFG